MKNTSTPRTRLAGIVEATALFFFCFQALRVLFSVLFGLIYDALFAGRASMVTVGLVLAVTILALLAPLAAPRKPCPEKAALLAGAVLVFVARIPLTLNDPQSRLIASLVIIAAAGLYLAVRLRHNPRDVARALLLALVAGQLLRTAGQTWDLTLRQAWWPGQAILSLALCLLAGWRFRQSPAGPPAESPGPVAGSTLSLALFWGGWLFLQASLLVFPNAMARWSGGQYSLLASLVPFVMILPLAGEGLWRSRRGWIDGLFFLLLLLGGLLLGYLAAGPLAALGLLLAQVALLFLLFSHLRPTNRPGAIRSQPPSRGRHPGTGLALGNVLFLILGFAYAFTFTYAYTLDLFRNMGLPIFLLAGLLAGLPALRLPPATGPLALPPRRRVLLAFGAAVLLMLLAFGLSTSFGPSPAAARDSIRFATYNIHYGYDTVWHLSLEDQARTLETEGADVVMMQEVDTGRPTSYMIDDALWLARRLDMEAVYLPAMEHLTGIAILSRYPVLDSEILLLPSELEQTGIVRAELDVGGRSIQAFGIWLGLEPEERARQIDAALAFIAAHPGPAAFGGDFNSTPDSPVYARIAAAGFVDPFPVLGLGSPPTDPSIQPTKRIDFVWLRGLEPVAAWVPDSTASDHRPVVVEARLP